MAEMTKAIPFNFLCLGGDACRHLSDGATETVNEILNEVMIVNQYANECNCPLISIPGNHDAGQNNNSITF